MSIYASRQSAMLALGKPVYVMLEEFSRGIQGSKSITKLE